ncbi:phage tail protein [Roseovarius sp. 10]|uniref:phage tail protein n=1 Tax=Roseovarius sp. 10 TaxID=3080563 RepID=UPI0029539886|nr:phage tail protein [Roseovarius sp. 10]MDV7200180.1 phage tail protein [Roseovarius sp. 10]
MPPVVIGAVALGGAAVAAGGVAAAFAAGGLIGFAANFGASMLLSAATQSMMPKPSLGQMELQSRTVTVREPVMPRQMVYGRTRKGGVITFLHSTGAQDKYLHLVVVLASHRVESIGAIYFEGEMAVDATGQAQGRWAGKVTIEKRLGRPNQAAFADLITAAPEFWTSAHRLSGCAALYLRLTYDQDTFPGGIPNITVDIEGKDDIFDPRTGSTGFTQNAALCIADYMAHPIFGLGAAIGAEDGISIESLIEAANICDELIPLATGGSEPRYACDGVISLAETPKTIIEAMLTSMAGRCVWQSGAWHMRAGAYRIPSEILTSDDIREGGIALTTRQSRSSNFNAVRGQFVSPENDWQPDDFPGFASEVYRLEDGGEQIWRDISLPFTISAAAAQRIAKIELERNRRQQTLKLSGKLKAWRVAAGETALFKYSRWGFDGDALPDGKPFEVQSVRLDLTQIGEGVRLAPELILRETSPLVYSWSASEEQIYAAAPRTTLPSAFDVAPPGAPKGEEELYVTRDGSAVKVLLRIIWPEAQNGFVDTYQVEAQRDGLGWQDYGRTTGTSFELRDIRPGQWTFRVKAISVLGVSSIWREGAREVVGLTAPPEPLEGLTIQNAGGLAILKWERSRDVDVRVGGNIIIRHSVAEPADWSSSIFMDKIAGAEAIAVVPLKPGTYLVRAEDSEGRLGAIRHVTTKASHVLGFAPFDQLQAEPAFLGAKTNLTVQEGSLRIPEELDPSGVPQTQSYEGLYQFETGLDFGALKRVRVRSHIEIGALALRDDIDARLNNIDDWADFDGTDGAEVDAVIELRETDDDPNDAPNWSPWGRIDSHEIEARAIEARARITTTDRAFTPAIFALQIRIDEVSP